VSGPGAATARSGTSRTTVVLVALLVALTAASGIVWWDVLKSPRTASAPAAPGPAEPAAPPAPTPSEQSPVGGSKDDLPRSARPLADDQIVWRHNVGTDWTMSTVSASGVRATVVLASGEQEVAPVVSHDRRTVLYLRRERPGERTSLHAVAADGRVQRLLFRDGTSSCPFLRQVVWSVDGTLGVVCKLDEQGTSYSLSIAALDGTFIRTLDVGLIGGPTISPDGRRILYPKASSGSYRRGGSLYVTDVDGSTEPTKTVGGRNTGPAWSPDGSTIAFSRIEDDDVAHILTMPVGGEKSDIDVLTSKDRIDVDPSWSPDSASLVFRRGSDDEHFRLMVMTGDGDDERELSRSGTVGSPSWTPR
jgi:Tol biopolymer transport system component